MGGSRQGADDLTVPWREDMDRRTEELNLQRRVDLDILAAEDVDLERGEDLKI